MTFRCESVKFLSNKQQSESILSDVKSLVKFRMGLRRQLDVQMANFK